MKQILGILITLFLVACASSRTNDYGVNVISQSEYESRVMPVTREIETYKGLMNTMHLSATLINSQVAEAQLLQKARLYQWNPEMLESEKKKINEELNKETHVFVSLYTPDRKHDDLHKNKTLWNTFLDANGRRWQGKATKIKLLPNEVQALYPDHTRFATPYIVTFPVPANSIEGQKIKFTLTGSVAAATLEF